jgi:hypothetical protein
MRNLLFFLLLTAACSFAADIAGTWKGVAEGPNGSMSRTFSFQVDGNKLTGETVSSLVGKSTIEDGKVDGDSLSFVILIKFQDNEMKVTYKGKLTGKDEMKLSAENPQSTIEWVAKRSS